MVQEDPDALDPALRREHDRLLDDRPAFLRCAHAALAPGGLLAIALLYVAFWIYANNFLTFRNQVSILRDAATFGIAYPAAKPGDVLPPGWADLYFGSLHRPDNMRADGQAAKSAWMPSIPFNVIRIGGDRTEQQGTPRVTTRPSTPASNSASISSAVPTVKRPPASSQVDVWSRSSRSCESGSRSSTETS